MAAVLYHQNAAEAFAYPAAYVSPQYQDSSCGQHAYHVLAAADAPPAAAPLPAEACAGDQDPMQPAPGVADGALQRPTNSVLNTYRGEVMQAAQRRDVTRLKIMVSILVHHHRLTPKELDICLVLHHVVWAGELNDIAEFLISLGCDPYFPDINGDTVFHYTVRGSNLEFLRSLFSVYGSRTLEVLNNNHFNLFLTAASESSDEKAYDILNVLEWLYLNGCSIESQDANGKTGLMWACQRGSLSLVQWFLSRGANLAHRDHNGRTVLQMACVSGDEDTVRTICEVGAIALLDCESNDERESNTALKLCWNKGHFFLALSLRQWYFQKRLLGTMRVFRSVYASYYWALMGTNFAIFLSMAMTLIQQRYENWYHCFVFLCLFAASQLCWMIAFKSDPGYVKQYVIPDQSYRCSPSFRYDLSQRPVFGYRVTSACYQLQLLERDLAWISAELTALNRHFGIRHGSVVQFPPDAELKFENCVMKIQSIREQMFGLMDKVGQERRVACPRGYAKQVLDGIPKRVCLTCRIVKPFRAHHCGDCSHCIHRFDHHCIWVDNCIGLGNQRSFLFFLCCLTLSIGYFWFLVGMYYVSHVMKKPDDALDLFTEPLFYVALTNSLCNLLWAGFVGYLFGRTFKSMCTNITFYEYLKKPSHIQQRFQGQVYTCFWDLMDLTPLRVLRNIYGFWCLETRWDQEDYGHPCAIGYRGDPALPAAEYSATHAFLPADPLSPQRGDPLATGMPLARTRMPQREVEHPGSAAYLPSEHQPMLRPRHPDELCEQPAYPPEGHYLRRTLRAQEGTELTRQPQGISVRYPGYPAGPKPPEAPHAESGDEYRTAEDRCSELQRGYLHVGHPGFPTPVKNAGGSTEHSLRLTASTTNVTHQNSVESIDVDY